MSPRVILLTTNLARGGAETEVALLAVELRRRGWEPAVVSLLPPAAFTSELEAKGVPVHSLDMRRGAADVRGLARLVAFVRRWRPQVLHSHMFHANLMARIARLVCPVPVAISTIHSIAESGGESDDVRRRDRAYRLTEPLSDLVVAVCHAAAERHASTGAARRGKLRVIPNGVDTAAFRPNAEARERLRGDLGAGSRFVWLAAGRLHWKKDYPTLLRAFAGERGSLLWIAGEGPEEDALKSLAGELACDARFLGRRDDIADLMSAADAFVLSSAVEGLPLVLLEAAACGLPSVATAAGGVSEIVVDGETGYVVPPGDAQALGTAMSRLSSLPVEERRRMSAAARSRAEREFDLGHTVAQWERTYRELLERERAWM